MVGFGQKFDLAILFKAIFTLTKEKFVRSYRASRSVAPFKFLCISSNLQISLGISQLFSRPVAFLLSVVPVLWSP